VGGITSGGNSDRYSLGKGRISEKGYSLIPACEDPERDGGSKKARSVLDCEFETLGMTEFPSFSPPTRLEILNDIKFL
jgi:hypothetical protein